MKHKVRVKRKELPKAEMGFYSKGKLTHNAFQFPVNFKEGMEPGLDVKKNLGPVARDKANIEAEKGETILTSMGDDAWSKSIPKTFIIGGKKHHSGGTPLNVPEGSFIFSDHLKEKNQEILKMLGKAAKKSGYTYAELSKPFMLNDDIKLLLDPDSDRITRETAQMNIQNKMDKLGLISLLQESSKGFENDEGEIDIPSVGIPYADKLNLDIEQAIDPFLEAIKAPVQEQAYNQEMQGQMPPMQGMPEAPMQPQMGMRKGGLVKYSKGGGVKKYQNAGTIGQDERVRFNRSTGKYELVDATGRVVGYVSPSGTNSKSIKITRSQIPDNAIVIDRSKFATTDAYNKALKETYTNAAGAPVVVKNADGSFKLVGQRDAFENYKSDDLDTLFAGQKAIAYQYKYIEDKFNNPKVKEELRKRAIDAINNPDNVRGLTSEQIRQIKEKLNTPDGAYELFMDMQKRNLSTYAHSAKQGKSIADFKNNPDPSIESTNEEFKKEWERIGLTTPGKIDAAAEQALYIGYQDIINDKANLDPEIAAAFEGFDIDQVGMTDDEIRGKVTSADPSGKEGIISKIDGIYTNTTTGQLAKLNLPKEFYESDLLNESTMTPTDPISPQYRRGDVRKGWTAPDIAEFARATGERFAPAPPEPFQAFPNYYLPPAFVLSPEDMQNQLRGMNALALENVRAYAPGPAAMSASTQVNADALTQQTAAIHNANQQIINQHSQGVGQILNRAAENFANLTTGLYDKWTNRKEAMQARKSAAKAEMVRAFGQGETNEAGYQAMNLQTPNYQWDPYTQDYIGFIPSGPISPDMSNNKTALNTFEEYQRRLKGVPAQTVWQIAKADAGIPGNDIPDYLNYQAGLNG